MVYLLFEKKPEQKLFLNMNEFAKKYTISACDAMFYCSTTVCNFINHREKLTKQRLL